MTLAKKDKGHLFMKYIFNQLRCHFSLVKAMEEGTTNKKVFPLPNRDLG
jgi:hypothetical protein